MAGPDARLQAASSPSLRDATRGWWHTPTALRPGWPPFSFSDIPWGGVGTMPPEILRQEVEVLSLTLPHFSVGCSMCTNGYSLVDQRGVFTLKMPQPSFSPKSPTIPSPPHLSGKNPSLSWQEPFQCALPMHGCTFMHTHTPYHGPPRCSRGPSVHLSSAQAPGSGRQTRGGTWSFTVLSLVQAAAPADLTHEASSFLSTESSCKVREALCWVLGATLA